MRYARHLRSARLSGGILREIYLLLFDLERAETVYGCNVGDRISFLYRLLTHLRAKDKCTADKRAIEATKRARLRAFVASRFNYHCPICGRLEQNTRKWLIKPKDKTVIVNCLRCNSYGLKFEIKWSELL